MCDFPRVVKICKFVQLTSEEEAKEWKVFRYQRLCFSELQNTTYTEGTVLLIFSKVYRRLIISRDPLQWTCLNKDLVVVLSSLHMSRNKLKGSKISFASL